MYILSFEIPIKKAQINRCGHTTEKLKQIFERNNQSNVQEFRRASGDIPTAYLSENFYFSSLSYGLFSFPIRLLASTSLAFRQRLHFLEHPILGIKKLPVFVFTADRYDNDH